MNVVIDLETLSTSPHSVILSVGAVAESGEQFYTELDWRAQTFRHTDPDTCLWWGQQEKDLCPLKGEVKLSDCLMDLNYWLADYEKDNLFVWARGPQFDIVILEDAYKEAMLPIPWHSHRRCGRPSPHANDFQSINSRNRITWNTRNSLPINNEK